eukprot:TRINITY_DN7636_c1_g1_i1.p1 TRINITY_DN7636_c1_g1~~TRINITY_DN7636_c1_g1_i1.p1  ORF type:complete len:125 (-),score=21.47 TRINITY_DN7636_c1_g1_i1:98-472(-)
MDTTGNDVRTKGVEIASEDIYTEKQHKMLKTTDKYKIRKILAVGTISTTYSLTDKGTGEELVMKEIDMEGVQEESTKQIQTLEQLKHPNILSYKESFVDGTKLNIVMEHCNFGNYLIALEKRKK